MRFQYYFLIILALFLSTPVSSQDIISEEVVLRETPRKLYNQLIPSIGYPLAFNSRDEFNRVADKLSYPNSELQHKLYLLARLNMKSNIKDENKDEVARKLIEQLEAIAVTPYDFAIVNMLKGRYIGRVENNYEEAINLYNQALSQIQEYHELNSILLKHTIHEHLGMLYLITRKAKPALKHLNAYREHAYQLRNNYLITAAEAMLGKYYNKQGKQALALQHYSEAFRLANQEAYPKQTASLQLRLARVYRDLRQWDEALKHAHSAAESYRELGVFPYVSSAMTVMAMVNAEQGQWHRAIDYYLNAQQIDSKLGNITAQALNFHNLGEAHSNIGDIESSLNYLLQANQIFSSRNAKHYLIANELLIAEVAIKGERWQLAEQHASIALPLAKEMELTEEQVEALKYQAIAYKQLNKLDDALTALDTIIALNDHIEPQDANQYSPSLLTEQKLKLEISLMKDKLTKANKRQDTQNTLLAVITLICALLLIVIYHFYRQRKRQDKQLVKMTLLAKSDAATQLPGYYGFKSMLGNADEKGVLTMFNIPSLNSSDIEFGQRKSNQINQEIINAVKERFTSPCYLIRPGTFALKIKSEDDLSRLLVSLRQAIPETVPHSLLAVGCIKLPIFNDQKIKVPVDMQLETLQFALNGALSVSEHKDTYVSLRTLDFAPASIFSRPLYLHMEKAVQRGLIRVDSNEEKTNINWNSKN